MLTCCFGRLIFGGKKPLGFARKSSSSSGFAYPIFGWFGNFPIFRNTTRFKSGSCLKVLGKCVCVCLPMISNWSNLEKMIKMP